MVAQWQGAGTTGSDTIDVLACNWLAVEVYRLCQWTVCMGAASGFWLGIASQELRAVIELKRVLPDAWDELIDKVRLLVAVARPLLNAKR